MSDSLYTGPVGFGSDGVHYPLDPDGHLDLTRPLTWVADDPHPDSVAGPSGETHPDGGYYRDRTDDDLGHQELYHVNHVELDLGGETITVDPSEADAVRAFLEERRGQ